MEQTNLAGQSFALNAITEERRMQLLNAAEEQLAAKGYGNNNMWRLLQHVRHVSNEITDPKAKLTFLRSILSELDNDCLELVRQLMAVGDNEA